KSQGRNGSYSTNYQSSGRELLMPDEVRLLDNRYAILFIRGERPVKDLKYDITKHPNVGLTTDGKGKPYLHGSPDYSVGTVSYAQENEVNINFEDFEDLRCKILSSEEINEYLNNLSED
ncbi:MAG: type IV secretory system conjugative DNA transfer family protein, partial [Ruminococcus sp.]|nr:type IV secretory system conjugative DNA transfer family protein [Candidatus Copronaster equi]